MKSKYRVDNISINKVLKLTIIILFITSSIFTLSNLFFINNTKASENTAEWQVTLNITGSDGTKDTVVFGEKNDASNSKDQYDMPKPPDPPIPFIRASFTTNLEEPYNTLWEDYKALSEDYKVWNLTIIWFSDNNLTTNITISWETSEMLASGYDSVYLHNAEIIDMKTDSNYQYTSSNSEPHNFQIILQNKELNGASDTNNITSILLIALIIVIIIIIIVAVYIKKRK